MYDERIDELRHQQLILTRIRAGAVPFAALQVLTYYQPHPPGVRPMALSFVALLAVGAATVWWGVRQARTLGSVRRWSLGGLLVDSVVGLGLVVSYTFDPNTAVWALLYLLPLEGAMAFQLRGALGAFALVAVGYTAREVYGHVAHGIPFLAVSITFRMGVGLMMAIAMGLISRGLTSERDRLRVLSEVLRRRGEALAGANAALHAARRAQIEFVAVTNHELRTPLTAIKGFALTLHHRWDDMAEPAKRAAVQAIAQQSTRLGDLVEDLLTVSSMRSGDLAVSPRSLVLADWLHQAVEASGVEATVHCPPDAHVQADSTRLLQILVNLLTNAQKYGAPPIVVTGISHSGRCRIEVADHGPGVPATFESRMFEEFTQASIGETRTAGGHGLGLTIVRYLAEALSGSVDYRPGDGGGAVFTVDLPAGLASPRQITGNDPSSAASPSLRPPNVG